MKHDHLRKIKCVKNENLWALDFMLTDPHEPMKMQKEHGFGLYFSEHSAEKIAQAEEVLLDATANLEKFNVTNRFSPCQIYPSSLISGIVESNIVSEQCAFKALLNLLQHATSPVNEKILKSSGYFLNQFKSEDIYAKAVQEILSATTSMPGEQVIISAINNKMIAGNELSTIIKHASENAGLLPTSKFILKYLDLSLEINASAVFAIIQAGILNHNYEDGFDIQCIQPAIDLAHVNGVAPSQGLSIYAQQVINNIIAPLIEKAREQNHNVEDLSKRLIYLIKSSKIHNSSDLCVWNSIAMKHSAKLAVMEINATKPSIENYNEFIIPQLQKIRGLHGLSSETYDNLNPFVLSKNAEDFLIEETNHHFNPIEMNLLSIKNQITLIALGRMQCSNSMAINKIKYGILKAQDNSITLKQLDQLCYEQLSNPSICYDLKSKAANEEANEITRTIIELVTTLTKNPFSIKTIELILASEESNSTANNARQILSNSLPNIAFPLSEELKQSIVSFSESKMKTPKLKPSLYEAYPLAQQMNLMKGHLDNIMDAGLPRTSTALTAAVTTLINHNPSAHGLLNEQHIQELLESNHTREIGANIALNALLPMIDSGYATSEEMISQEAALGIVATLSEMAMRTEVRDGHEGTFTHYVRTFLSSTYIDFMSDLHHDFTLRMMKNSAPIYEGAVANILKNKLAHQPSYAAPVVKRNML